MNKIYKVMYSKVKQCCVVVSEIAKSHGRHTKSSVAKSSAALTAGVLIALGSFSFEGMPVVQAADGTESLRNNDFVGANDYYWYYDEKEKDKDKKWKTYQYKATDIFNNRSRHDLPNYQGGGAKLPGAITAGLYAQAGQQTVTIGDRNAGQSKGSVFIGEHSGYNNGDNAPAGMKNNYVTSVGFQSDATGWGSIAIGSNATAENSKMESQVVEEVGDAHTSGTVSDDTYGIKEKPTIQGASVALGYSAKAKDGNIAIGAYSDATDTSSATPYVSVGSSTLKRRITNVADGTGDTDVATVGQMNKAIESIGTTGWNLSTNGYSSSTTITSGKTVDFSPAVDGKNGTTDHKNVKISNDGPNVKIGLNKDIVLGEATEGEGGSLNVYSDSTEASNLGNRVSIDGSTVSVNYGKEDGTSGTKRGVVLGVGEDYNNNAQGYIAFNNIDAKGTIGSTYLHSATDAPNDLKGRLVYSNAIDGTEYIANLDDGITFTGDVQKDVPKDYTQTPTKLNTTLNITGGAATEKGLTSGNIGVVSTPAAEKKDGTTQASKLEIKLNKDLKGITSITSQTTDGTTTSGATITLGTNGTTISGGDVNVSNNKITGLKDGAADTDAATVGQMKTAIGDAKTKYYSVHKGPQIGGFSTNENNDGASALAGLAAGYETGTTGIVSTVVGSYSGVIGSGLQGAAAVSVGTVNVNNNTDTSKTFSGVANSIVGQANMTTDSNAAIIVGAGNSVTNSYRDLDTTTDTLSNIKRAVASKDANALKKALQDAVPKSGGQVMVMGGGNNVESAYMSQVVGVGNTVKGNQVENDKGEWGTDTSNTAIKYDPEKSSQYNYVDGFNNEVINGKHDYVIGANNKLSGDSYDDDKVLPIKRSNKSNIVIGDNHTLTREKNTVIIGSSDTENTQTKANDAVIIGHNANATSDTGADNAVAIGLSATAGGGNAVTIGVNTSAGDNSITIGSESHAISGENIAIGRYARVYGDKDGDKVTKAVALGQKAEAHVADGVAIGSDSIATVAGNSVEGYDPTTGQTSTDPTATWKATKAAVSIGTADGKVTRQINGVAAGTNDTDAVNVAQIKKLASINASNIGANLQYGADGTTAATDTDKTKNKEAWATAIGTGTVTKDDDGSKQMVTGKTVYDALHGGLDNITVGKDGQNGKDGSIGIAGQNGKDGYSITYIKTEQGAAGVDGKDGITRVVYQDKDGNGKHTFATLDDGLKFKGNDSTVIARKLNEQLNITGGADSTKLTDKNIGVNSSTDGLKIQLAKNLAGITSIANQTTTGKGDAQTTTGAKIDLKDDGSISVNSGKITDVKSGLTATDGTYADTDKNNAANIGDVHSMIEKEAGNTDDKLALKANVAADNIGTHITDTTAQKTNLDNWGAAIGTGAVADSTNEHANQLVTGKTVYDALHGGLDNITVGKDGKDGKDGSIGIAGQNGKDGYSITYIKTEQGAAGVDGKDGITRVVYQDKDGNGKHTFATLDDGLKFKGNDSTVIARKLNEQLNITGGADSTKLTDKNIGVNSSTDGLKIQLAKNLAGITSIANQTTTGKGDAQTTTGAKIDLKDDGSISVNSGKITDVKSGLTATDGTYADTDKNNAANIGDVHSMIEKEAGNTDDKLALKANVAADNIGTHITDTTAQKTNLDNWGEAIGTGKIADPDASDKETNGSKQLVTGGTVYNEVRPSKDGKYVKIAQTTGANLIALDDQVKQNAQNISDNTYAQGDGILMDKTKKTISVNKGDGLKFTEDHKLAVYTGNGLKIDNGAVAIKTSDSNLKVDSNGIGLSDKITIGSDKTKQVTIDGTKGEISGLTNTTWDSKADYSKSTKAATESQVDAAVKDAVKQAGENDIHVAAGSYAVNDQNQVSMNLVDKNNDTKGTVIITDVAKSSEMGDVSKLADGVKNAGGKTTTVVDAINNVNTSMNTKIGDQKYSTSNTSGTNKYVSDGDSITSAIGKLDGAVQQATTAAGQHSTVSAGSNITVTPAKQTDGHTDYQVALNKDITVDSVTAKTATTDTLTVNNSATIGGVTIANKTISGLDDTKIEKGSTNAVNAGTIWNELRPSGGTYINQNNTTAQNLMSLDTQVKKTSDLINSDGKTIKIGGSDAATKIDVNGKDGKGRVITGVVSDANDPNSAANVGYVNGLTAANTQQIYRDMNNAYGRLNNNINKAAAGSNALAALHPLDYDPDDKADFAVGYGHYRNANAAAVGAFYHPNENTMVNVGVSLGNGDPGFNAGVSFKVGRGGAGREAMSKTEMAKVINSQSKEIDALKKDNADKDKRIDALEQKMAEILAKLDKNGK